MNGYIKLARCLIEKPIFNNEKLLKVWIWCLFKASHKEHEISVGLQKVKLLPGQFVTGRKAGADELGLNQSTFWKYLCWLNDNESLNIKSNNKFSLVTVVNWASYQIEPLKDDNKSNSKVTAKRQQNDTNNNGNNGKSIYLQNFDEFWNAYPRQERKSEAIKSWNARVSSGAKPDDMITAAKNYAVAVKGKEKQFILQPTTFLGPNKRFEDYLQVTSQTTSGGEDEWFR